MPVARSVRPTPWAKPGPLPSPFPPVRPPGVRPTPFPSIPAAFTSAASVQPWGFGLFGSLTRRVRLMRFVFLGPRFRLRLPSDSASRRTPLPSATRFPLPGAPGTFTPWVCAMPGTPKKASLNGWPLRNRWWAMLDSNQRPHPCEGCALPLSQSPLAKAILTEDGVPWCEKTIFLQ